MYVNATRFFVLFALLLALPGCVSAGNGDMQSALSLEKNYKNAKEQSPNKIFENVRWWSLYDDPDLDALISHAFMNSPTLGQIRARLAQAGALKDKYSASLMPYLNIELERNTYRGSSDEKSDFDLSGAAGYEIDLWGKNRARSNAYKLKEQAAQEDLHAGAITLSANIVNSWLEILALVEQEKLLRSQIETNRTIYEMQKQRFEMGAAGASDVLQQEEALSASRAAMPEILKARELAVNALSLLIGEAPSESIVVHARPLPAPPILPPSGMPSQLLNERPDIVAAWLRLLSDKKSVFVAKADRLPGFDLSALYAAGNNGISGIIDSWLLTLAAKISAPIIDGGALKAEQRYREAMADEAFHTYRAVVLSAVGDVENALVANHYQDKKILALDEQLRAARETLEQAQTSYENGQIAYINVLSSLTGVQSLERQMISERLEQAKARVSMYRSLGGQGWAEIVPSVTTLMNYPGVVPEDKNKDKMEEKQNEEEGK